MTARSRAVRVRRVAGGGAAWQVDLVAEEEPLELRLGGAPLTVTMRTPGDDFDLAVGFLLCEGLVDDASQVLGVRACPRAGGERGNVLDVSLRPDAPAAPGFTPRAFATTSACGVCGSESIGAVLSRSHHDVAADPLELPPGLVAALADTLRRAQRAFDRTGGLHAAGLFDAEGRLLCAREDVGRHNALDKVVGRAATERWLPLRGRILVVSGRASFELVQKALAAGAPALAAVSAPSSLAVELARRSGMTLIGFLRGATFNVYAGEGRVRAGEPASPAVPAASGQLPGDGRRL